MKIVDPDDTDNSSKTTIVDPDTSIPHTRGVSGSWDAVANDIPEAVGGIAGGLLAAKRSTPMGAAVSAIGGAGGEAWKQVYQQITGDKNAPATPEEALKRIAMSGGVQALGEVGGRALFGGISKLIAPFKKTVTPGAMGADSALAKFMGTKTGLTPAQMTDSHLLDVAENVAEQSWVGGQTIMDYRKLQSAGYKNMESSILSDLSGYATTKATPEEVGLMFKDAKAFQNAVYKRLAGIKYGKVDELAGDALVNLSSLDKEASRFMEIAEARKGIGSTAAKDTLLKKVLSLVDPEKSTYPLVTFKEAQAIRTGLMDELQTMSTNADIGKGMTKKFIKVVDGAMEDGAKKASPEAYKAWREANQFYRGYKELFGTNFMRNLDKVADNAPEKVVASIFRDGAVTQIKNVKRIVKPATFQKLKASFTEQLFKKAESAESGELIGTSLQKKLQSIGTPALNTIYTPAELAGIRNFAAAGQALQKKSGGGGGMVIQLMQAGALGAGVGIITGSVSGGAATTAATILIGPKVLAKMLLNPTSARLLTRGLSLPAGSKEAMAIGSKLAADAAKIKLEGAEAGEQIEY